MTHSSTKARGADGFTLTEILIALGVMGVGLTMAAALFPAAIKEHESSVNNSLGMIVCENGLAVAQAMAPAMGNSLGPVVDENPSNTYSIPLRASHYSVEKDGESPLPDGTMTGFVLLGRNDDPGHPLLPLVQQLVAVSYARPVGHTVQVYRANCTITYNSVVDRYELTDNDPPDPSGQRRAKFQGPVIFGDGSSAGSFARVAGLLDSGAAVLDHPAPVGPQGVWFILEYYDADGDGDLDLVDTNPVMSVLVTRTSLSS